MLPSMLASRSGGRSRSGERKGRGPLFVARGEHPDTFLREEPDPFLREALFILVSSPSASLIAVSCRARSFWGVVSTPRGFTAAPRRRRCAASTAAAGQPFVALWVCLAAFAAQQSG